MNRETDLSSVLFLPGHADALLDKGATRAEQLDGVLELLQLAESLVLHDTTIVAGAPTRFGVFGGIIQSQSTQFKYCEVAGDGDYYQVNLGPYYEAAGIDDAYQEFRRLYEGDDYDAALPAMKAANERQAWSHMLLADFRKADYYPERRYGLSALKSYPKVLKKSTTEVQPEALRKLLQKLEASVEEKGVLTNVPSFLLEALRGSATYEGILPCLRDLWDSGSLRAYRDLARTVRHSRPTSQEWRQARSALEKQADAAFRAEGLQGRPVLRLLKPAIGLSIIAIALFFPGLSTGLKSVGILAPLALEEVDRYTQRRRNIFESYVDVSIDDLFTELRRLFPVKFGAEHLSFFLKNKHFGWSDQVDRPLYGGRPEN